MNATANQPRDQWVSRALTAVAVVAACVAALGAIAIITAPDPPWDPLEDYPAPQIVQGFRIEGVPRIPLDHAAVEMEGTKCYGPATVTVVGELTWRSADPPGTASPTVQFPAAESGPGCVTQVFRNPIPDVVVDVTCAAGEPTRWTVGGSDTPIDGDRVGVPRRWWSEGFDVDPRGAEACSQR